MSKYSIFDNRTGVITHHLTGSIPVAIELGDYGDFVEGHIDANTYYISTDGSSEVLAKTLVPYTLSATSFSVAVAEEVVFTDIPAGVSVEIEDVTYPITDGVLEFTGDLVGTYTLLFTGATYLDTTVTITGV